MSCQGVIYDGYLSAADGQIVRKPITPGSRLIAFLVFLSPLFWGCEYFNRPLEPFIEKHAAEVSVESVGFRFADGTGLTSVFRNGRYVADPGATPVTIHAVIGLDNPANLALDFSLSWTASDSGITAALGGTDNRRVEVRIEGARRGSRIELRVNAKAETNRTFRFFVPVVFNSQLTVKNLFVAGSVPSTPIARWNMQTTDNHPGIDRVVISYRYWNGTALVPVKEEYGWDESSGAGGLTTGGAPVSAGRNFTNANGNCAIDFPASLSISIPGSATVGYYCFFKIEVYDRFELSAGAETKGFSTVNANGSAKTGGVTYPTLNATIEAAAPGSPSPGNPTEIELVADIRFPEISDTYTIASKHIKLTVPQNQTKIVKRTRNNSGTFFTVSSGASLRLTGNGTGQLVLDGGAVWAGGAGNPLPSPSPAYGASNSGITATGPLVSSSGTLIIADGAVLQNNQNTTASDYMSGAVLISNGMFTMSGGIIKNNENTNSPHTASAIYRNGGTLNISGGEISGNNRDVAIQLNGGMLNFSGGEIKNNSGVIGLSTNFATVNMSGGAIKDNMDRIYIDGGHFYMSGGEISGNDSGNPGRGHAIDINTWPGSGSPSSIRSINMSGGARIASNNVVVTHNSWPLKISGDLTGTAPVATIQPIDYTVGHQVLSGYSRRRTSPNSP
jgi:hypothetical protein